ncbi:exo-beta-N-acetylmuramidase NamZ domain-containing protein [Filimonas effusa]|uniref:DUF1343 domain-containing protein n=1 Tax=Filimonas effusa TaxID=2508721 RepID=A0A4Q1D309_9BACT|nr:exo-beta-N-acetylmuramidase NamZ domain-containing protein [Filimonas effusa]RXK81455.1 DUF1343 domain-containing protein [Filimonas effusa]
MKTKLFTQLTAGALALAVNCCSLSLFANPQTANTATVANATAKDAAKTVTKNTATITTSNATTANTTLTTTTNVTTTAGTETDTTSGIPAIQQLNRYLPLLKGKRLGLVANHSSVINGKRSVDVLLAHKMKVVRLFGPEHGASGSIAANTAIASGKDERTALPVVSLFGTHVKPTSRELENIDLMLFDMQDVGVRFYTYISTLHYVMEACAGKGIPLIVFDRPNPNDGYIDGPVLQKGFESFIGMHPIPIVHALTIGEYAQMINGERWLSNNVHCNLTVIKMTNYRHGQPYHFSIPPSPNLNTLRAIYLYPSLCWFGATAISDGRGTYFPFQAIGHPLLKAQYAFSFVPAPIKGMNEDPRHKGDTCYGPDLRNYPTEVFGPGGQLNLQWLINMYRLFPDKSNFFNGEKDSASNSKLHFDLLAGNTTLRRQVEQGLPEAVIRASWQNDLQVYKTTRKKYLIYPDPAPPMKIMTYNIHHGADKDEKDQLKEMADCIKSSGADIVALQEVDSVCRRSGNRDQAAELAAQTGMHHIFVRHFAFENGAYGLALLSKFPIEKIHLHRLPIDASATQQSVAFFIADLKTAEDKRLSVAVVHMDYRSEASRTKQAGIITEILKQFNGPVILAGDMNSSPAAQPISVLNRAFTDAVSQSVLSFPAHKPDRKIDYIFISKHLKTIWSKAIEVQYSDHLPVEAAIENE